MSDVMESDLTEEQVRADVRTWLKANWDPELSLLEWRNKLVEFGLGAPHYPKEWHGRGLPAKFNTPIDDEFAQVGAITVARAGILVTLEPRTEEEAPSTHDGEEFIYVLEGMIEVQLGDKRERLQPEDSIYYDSTLPHLVRCGGDQPARILAVLYTEEKK